MSLNPTARMKLVGYIPLTERGFAIPTYELADRAGNAQYRAIPAIEGDHQTTIAAFELSEGPNCSPLDDGPTADVATAWIDVFLWNSRALFGTVSDIFAALADEHDEIRTEAPLTFLDLGLAVNAPDMPRASAAAREFLWKRLGKASGERSFREVVIRPGVSLEIRRLLHRHADAVPYGAGVGFETIAVSEDVFHVALDGETLRRVGSTTMFSELRVAIARFGQNLGLGIEILEPPPLPASGLRDDPVPPTLIQRRTEGGRKPRSRLLGLAQEMAIDLGTHVTRMHVRGRSSVWSEPSAIAIRTFAGIRKVLAVGDDARLMFNKEPGGVDVIRPLRDGAIVDLDAAVAMLSEFIRRVRPPRIFRRPLDVIVCPPAASTSVERRALSNAAKKAGASRVWLVESPLAAAVGAGLPIDEPVGSMIVQIGGGTTEIATIALRGIAYTTSVRIGGDAMDEAIVNHLRRHHNLLIGLRSAEHLKRQIGAARPPIAGAGAVAVVRGRDLVNRVPKEIEISSADISEAISAQVGTIIEAVRIALENTAPELAADIADTGIVLVGGGALLANLDELIADETGLSVRIADDPINCVTIGLAHMLEDREWRQLWQRS